MGEFPSTGESDFFSASGRQSRLAERLPPATPCDRRGSNLKEPARHFYAVLDSQNWVELATLVSPEVVLQLGSSPPLGFAEGQELLKGFYIGFPNGHHVIDDYLVGDDRVVTRCRFEGTHAGVFRGVQPTGKKVSVGVIHINRFTDGTLAEHFGQLDTLGLIQQIGALE